MTTSDTRTRIRDAAITLFARDGYPGTGLKRIAAESGAPFGSIYHFFPAGKEQLAEESVRVSGAAYGAMVLGILDGFDDPIEALERTFALAADNLEASGYADACPIATLASEVASSNERLRVASQDVFASWLDGLEHWFSRWIEDRSDRRQLAHAFLMLLEGAFLLCRTSRSREPMLTAGQSMVALTRPLIRRRRA